MNALVMVSADLFGIGIASSHPVSNSCLGAVLLSNLFMIRLQKGSVDCISFTEVSLELSLLSLFVVSLLFLLTSVIGVLSVFMSIFNAGCSLAPSTIVVFLVLLLMVTGLTIFISRGFVPFGFFWCFSGSSTSHDRQSMALFFAPEIHSNFML